MPNFNKNGKIDSLPFPPSFRELLEQMNRRNRYFFSDKQSVAPNYVMPTYILQVVDNQPKDNQAAKRARMNALYSDKNQNSGKHYWLSNEALDFLAEISEEAKTGPDLKGLQDHFIRMKTIAKDGSNHADRLKSISIHSRYTQLYVYYQSHNGRVTITNITREPDVLVDSIERSRITVETCMASVVRPLNWKPYEQMM
ncbi:hypothetical protein [Microbulbifer epialgicus]|uniref:Uncharacterized protein n=1 Tax=Microbulbifer epialgicus TaxID=393907 RepID=A0ABV4P5Z1_9GAMM